MIKLHKLRLIRLLLLVFLILSLTGCKFKPSGPCDSNLAIDSVDPIDAAKALGICDGLVTATWEMPDGTTATSENFAFGHGILSDFGVSNPAKEGGMILVLSSGRARRASDTDYESPSSPGFDKNYTNGLPQASNMQFPIASHNCPTPLDAHDGISLSVSVVVPSGVSGYSFDFNYFTADYPESVCTEYADQAAVIVSDQNITNKNVLLYGLGNPVTSQTVEYYFCLDSAAPPCPGGSVGLIGTGFDKNGATGWNTVNVSAKSGDTVILKFMLWDSGDGKSDSTILFDNFKWLTP